MAGVHVGVSGLRIIVTFQDTSGSALDISVASNIQLFLRPEGARTAASRAATRVSTGSAGLAFYTTSTGDLSQPGIWLVQGKITFNDGFEGRTDYASFAVAANG